MTRHILFTFVVLSGAVTIGAILTRPEVDRSLKPQTRELMQSATSVSRQVDAEFEAAWRAQGLVSAERADHLLIARRLSLSLTGTVPSLEEIRALEAVATEDQIGWWLQHLFEDQRYGHYLGERFARAFVGTEDGPFLIFRRRRFVAWLSDWLMENKPYDEMVRQLISEHGNWTGKPAVNFVTVTTGTTDEQHPDPEVLAARTTRAFLGVRLDCVQCHDDNLGGDWKQSDFQELAAFYAEARSFGLGLGIQDTPREYEFRYLDAADEVVVDPGVPFAEDLLDEGRSADGLVAEQRSEDVGLAETPRRQRLAEWVTHAHNQAFSRALVNRVWGLMFGRPLIVPVDDIPLEGPYPPGMELLADDFSKHHDLQRLIVQIAQTRVFQQSSQLPAGVTAEAERHWAVFPLVRLRPEQVAGSIVQSASLSTIDSHSHVVVKLAHFGQIGDFVKRYGDRGEDEFVDRGGTIPQRLVMLNGELVRERTKDDLVANAATRIAQQVRDNDRAVEAAFLITLTRRPNEVERAHFSSLLNDETRAQSERAQQELDRSGCLEDIVWSLLNSTEFSWNH